MLVYNEGETLTVETDRSQIEKIIATFDHFIIMDDVEVKNISENWTALGLTGPRSRAILNAAGIEVPELHPLQTQIARCNCDCGCVNCTVVRDEDATQESYEIWLAPKDVTLRGMHWLPLVRRRWVAKRWRCSASSRASRFTAWIFGSATCRRKPNRCGRSTSTRAVM